MSLQEEVHDLMPYGERGWVKSIQLLAAALDKREMELERVRVHLGFGSDWSPVYDRTQRTAPNTPVRWADKCGTINGLGMITPFLQEMAQGMDEIEVKMAEASERMGCETASELHVKRKPGRPSNAERDARKALAS
jgi:hypothetical protein